MPAEPRAPQRLGQKAHVKTSAKPRAEPGGAPKHGAGGEESRLGDPSLLAEREPSLRAERELKQHDARHQITERRRVVQLLRRALATNGLSLHFQPIIALESGQPTGAEAQIRLNHARRGLIPAGHFLPIAEKSDVVIDAGRWMLRQTCFEAAKLPAHVRLSLALSQRHLQSGQLARHLLEALHISKIAPDRLELLITETMLLDENEDTVFALRAVRGLGVRLGLNHFGTGYASLAPLKRLPFSTLRLDKSLVQNLDESIAVTAIIQAAVEAGHALGCRVLADGVESAAQEQLLRHARADEAQGLFFAPAMAGAKLAELFS